MPRNLVCATVTCALAMVAQAQQSLKEITAPIPPEYAARVEALWPKDAPVQNHGLNLSKRNFFTARDYLRWLCKNDAVATVYKHPDVPSEVGLYEMRFPLYDLHYTRKEIVTEEQQVPGWLVTKAVNPQFQLRNEQLDYLENPYLHRYLSFSQLRINGEASVAAELSAEMNGYLVYFFPVEFKYEDRPPNTPSDTKSKVTRIYNYSRTFFLEREATEYDRKRWPYLGRSKYVRFSVIPPRPEWDRSEWPLVKAQSDGTGILSVTGSDELKSQFAVVWRGVQRSPNDRALGIGGGEKMLIDMRDWTVLSFARAYTLAYYQTGFFGPKPGPNGSLIASVPVETDGKLNFLKPRWAQQFRGVFTKTGCDARPGTQSFFAPIQAKKLSTPN